MRSSKYLIILTVLLTSIITFGLAQAENQILPSGSVLKINLPEQDLAGKISFQDIGGDWVSGYLGYNNQAIVYGVGAAGIVNQVYVRLRSIPQVQPGQAAIATKRFLSIESPDVDNIGMQIPVPAVYNIAKDGTYKDMIFIDEPNATFVIESPIFTEGLAISPSELDVYTFQDTLLIEFVKNKRQIPELPLKEFFVPKEEFCNVTTTN